MGLKGLIQPFLLKKIIEFIKNAPKTNEFEKTEDISWGVALVLMSAINELTEVFLDRHKDLYIST